MRLWKLLLLVVLSVALGLVVSVPMQRWISEIDLGICGASALTDSERESLTNCQVQARNAALELAAHYFSAMGEDKSYSVPQIVAALRSLQVERRPRPNMKEVPK